MKQFIMQTLYVAVMALLMLNNYCKFIIFIFYLLINRKFIELRYQRDRLRGAHHFDWCKWKMNFHFVCLYDTQYFSCFVRMHLNRKMDMTAVCLL